MCCQGKHTSFSRSCPKWELDKEIVTAKFKNNISFPEARRLVKAQTPPDDKSYASVVDKSHLVYQTTKCPHCNHVVTMSDPVPSTSKSPEPDTIASSYGTKNKNILPKPSSQTPAVPPDLQDSSGFTVVNRKKKPKISSKSQSANNDQIKANTATEFWKNSPQTSATEKDKNKILKNKTHKKKISTAKTANSTSESSEETSSDTDSDLTVTSAPEKDLPTKLKKSAHHNSVALGLADRGIVQKDLPSVFGGVPQVPDLKLHPSDEDLQMNCDASETPPCVPTSNPPTLS
ncbi:hypothetical protein AVEN_184437-1 [Araneus ventricosus]|uniref:Uncharacterized protein n=1 Tax=Araneus ventricosus TaxID=182803 RepID=A0A4Y2BIH2_ARAVE|nr:hypothetical protein AVEN_184437-1 [Araneus ventricosus]